MRALVLIAAMTAICLHVGKASATVPEFGTAGGDLACVGLLKLGFRGATASRPQDPKAVLATGLAYSFFIGRLSATNPDATAADADVAAAKLTREEQNLYVNSCLKRAMGRMAPHLEQSANNAVALRDPDDVARAKIFTTTAYLLGSCEGHLAASTKGRAEGLITLDRLRLAPQDEPQRSRLAALLVDARRTGATSAKSPTDASCESMVANQIAQLLALH